MEDYFRKYDGLYTAALFAFNLDNFWSINVPAHMNASVTEIKQGQNNQTIIGKVPLTELHSNLQRGETSLAYYS